MNLPAAITTLRALVAELETRVEHPGTNERERRQQVDLLRHHYELADLLDQHHETGGNRDEITVMAAPAAKDSEAFLKEVRTSISKISNLCGWSRDEQEFLMQSVDTSPLVNGQWDELQGMPPARATSRSGSGTASCGLQPTAWSDLLPRLT